jgi:hypothetical protein
VVSPISSLKMKTLLFGVLLSRKQIPTYVIWNALVTHVLSQAKNLGAKRVNIGIIAEQNELKKWYKEIGFVEQESKEFPRLPFNVTFMSYKLDKK